MAIGSTLVYACIMTNNQNTTNTTDDGRLRTLGFLWDLWQAGLQNGQDTSETEQAFRQLEESSSLEEFLTNRRR